MHEKGDNWKGNIMPKLPAMIEEIYSPEHWSKEIGYPPNSMEVLSFIAGIRIGLKAACRFMTNDDDVVASELEGLHHAVDSFADWHPTPTGKGE